MTFENDQDTGAIQQFDFSIDLLQALLWQYNDAPNLQALLEAKNTWYIDNQTDFWESWFTNVFNLATANDFGLAVWSIILNQPTYINGAAPPSLANIWGFGTYNQNFGNGNFGQQNGYTYNFSTETARLLLQLRYFQLVSSGTVPETNRMLEYLFEQSYGTVFLLDQLNMTQRYYFEFTIPSEILLMLTSLDILPRPAGVLNIIHQGGINAWGLGPNNANFGNGNFFNGEYIGVQ